MANEPRTNEEVEALIAELAAAKPTIEFAIKIGRQAPGGGMMPVPIAHMSGAKAAHLTSPETWLPLVGGGGTYHITVLDPSVDRTTGKQLGIIRRVVGGKPSARVDPKIVEDEKWRGPLSMDWTLPDDPALTPPEAPPPALAPASREPTKQTQAAAPSPAGLDPATAAEFAAMRATMNALEESARLARAAAADAQAALLREKEEQRRQEADRKREEQHKQDMERVRKEAEAAAAATKSELAQVKASLDAVLAKLAAPPAVQGPSIVDILLRQSEQREKEISAQAKRDEDQRRWQSERDKETAAATERMLEKIASKGDGQLEGLTKMTQMMGNVMSTSMQAFQASLDMQRAMQPAEREESTADTISAVGDALAKVIPALTPRVAPTPGQPQVAPGQPQQLPPGEPPLPGSQIDDNQMPSQRFLQPFIDHIQNFGEVTQFVTKFFAELGRGESPPVLENVRLRRVTAQHETPAEVATALFSEYLRDWYLKDPKKADAYLEKLDKAFTDEIAIRQRNVNAASQPTQPPAKA